MGRPSGGPAALGRRRHRRPGPGARGIARDLPEPAQPSTGSERATADQQQDGIPAPPGAVPGRDANRRVRRHARWPSLLRQPGGGAAARPWRPSRAGPDELAEVYRTLRQRHQRPIPGGRDALGPRLEPRTSHADNMEIRRPDATVPIEVWGTPIVTGDNNVEFAITAFADVSERRRVAEEVQLLSAITANMSEGVVVVRAVDGTVTYANRSLETMFGYDTGELVGRSFHDLTASGLATPESAASFMMTALSTHGVAG